MLRTSVPKTAVNKDSDLCGAEDKIRLVRQPVMLCMEQT
jgi:hypothetical protein